MPAGTPRASRSRPRRSCQPRSVAHSGCSASTNTAASASASAVAAGNDAGDAVAGVPPWRRAVMTGLRGRAHQLELERLRLLEAGPDVRPVPQVPGRLEEVGLAVLVLQVPGVLPGVEHHDRDAGL